MEYSVSYKISKDRKTIHICRPNCIPVEKYLANPISRGSIYVIKQVEFETGNKMDDVIAQAIQRSNLSATRARQLKVPCMTRFQTLHKGVIHDDDLSLLSRVYDMYRCIWSNSSKDEKKRIWASKKRKLVSDGPPMDGDLFILSTAAKLAETYDVELLTLDHDFIIFKDEIKTEFNILVVDAGALPL